MTPEQIHSASHQYFARLHRAALVLTGNPWDADDLAQETFLVLADRYRDFQHRSSLYTWLYGILLNLERRHRRRAGLNRRKLLGLWNGVVGRTVQSPGADVPTETAEWKRSLWSLVARLPDGQRQALVLRYSESMHYEEIADVLGCPLGTVKSRIFNGLAALRVLAVQVDAADLEIPRHPLEDLHHAV